MVLSLNETDNGLIGAVIYNTELFDEETVRRLFAQYGSLLQRVVANPQQPLSQVVGYEEQKSQTLAAR